MSFRASSVLVDASYDPHESTKQRKIRAPHCLVIHEEAKSSSALLYKIIVHCLP
jgi:hypothetical protein